MTLEHSYFAFGLGITSALRLPELLPGDGTADVEIYRTASVPPDALPPGPTIETPVAPNEWRLTYDDVGVITVRDGKTIELAPLDGVSSRTARLTLLGPGMATVLHQRGFLVLHASVVEIGGRAMAFLGDSGSGKSTLAAALHARGHRLIADDVAAVRLEPGGPKVYAGYPRFKLWPDALNALGHDAASLRRVERGIDKRAHCIREGFTESAALPLARYHVLDEGPSVELSRIPAHEGFLELVSYAYGIQRLDGVSGREHFQTRFEIAHSVPGYRLSRPWDLTRMSEVVARIERELDVDA